MANSTIMNPTDRRVHVLSFVFADMKNVAVLTEQCTVSVLKNLRLVSEGWYQESLPAWRQKATLRINCGTRGIPTERSVRDYMYLAMMQEIEGGFYRFREVPFRSYKLMVSSFELKCRQDVNSMACTPVPRRDFMEVVGPHMVHVNFYEFPLDYNVHTGINVLAYLENVETVVFDKCFFQSGSIERSEILCYHGRSLKLLNITGYITLATCLKGFPLLQNLTACVTTIPTVTNPVPLTNIYHNLQRLQTTEATHVPLKSLNTLNHYQKLDGLAAINMPRLESLSISINSRTESNLLLHIMPAYAPILKKLTLYRSNELPPLHSFPFNIQMSCMEEIYLLGRVTTALNFLFFMPSLRKVVVDQLCLNRSEQVPFDRRTMMQAGDLVQNSYYINSAMVMEHLFHLDLDSMMSEMSWKTLSTCLPRLRVIRAVLDNSTFRLICQTWPRLHTLTMHFGSQVNEKGLTGIEDNPTNSRRPNLINLIELEKFELFSICGGSCITDYTVYYTFLRMPTLDTLNIVVAPSLTEQYEKSLREKIPEVNIYRNFPLVSHQHDEINAIIHCCSYKAQL